MNDRIPSYVLFVDPPLARIDQTNTHVLASGRKVLTSKMMMTRVGRAREIGETTGFMKVVVDAETKQILGAAILGVHVEVILVCVRWYTADPLSCRHIEEIMEARGAAVDHSSTYR